MTFTELFEHDLVRNSKEVVPLSSLEGKHVLIYFSAHWCPPCRGFTPSLVEFYKSFKEKNSNFEIVFVSSDKDEAAFDEYFGEMPWLALPFEHRDKKQKLSQKFKVSGIPTLVVLDPTGTLITSDGRSSVSKDPQGEKFPWIPPTLEEALGKSFVSSGNTSIERELKGKVTGLYFSAHWCPPCQRFTPQLIETYKQLKDQGKDFEIVFISSDRDQSAFDHYFGEMPWIAVPFDDSERRQNLGELFEIEGIPSLIILDETLSTITKNGVSAVSSKLEFPFRPPPVYNLSMENLGEVNDSPALFAFGDFKSLLEPIATESIAQKKGVIFYSADPSDAGTKRLQEFANLKDDVKLMILDIPSGKKFKSTSSEVTADVVAQFLSDYHAEKLTGLGIKE